MSNKESTLAKLLILSWQKPNWLTVLLWPLSQIYRAVFAVRRQLYKRRILPSYTAPVPVVVVGNLSVGGTGKTPLVIYLVEQLRELGFKPGVISRGYGGNADSYPLVVDYNTSVLQSGDEPALIVKRTAVPMVVGPDRAADVRLLLASAAVDIIISDDGLQYLALERDIEICLLDYTSTLVNQNLLPAGPLRESIRRLASVDLVVHHQAMSAEPLPSKSNGFAMCLEPSQPTHLSEDGGLLFDASQPVHAVAGIGNPQRFFNTCDALGLAFCAHSFADHHAFSPEDLDFDDDLPILMTEKDAVKCQAFANSRHWYLPVNAKLNEDFIDALSEQLRSSKSR